MITKGRMSVKCWYDRHRECQVGTCGCGCHARSTTESDICPATLAHGIGVYHCRLLGEHREHQAGDLRWRDEK